MKLIQDNKGKNSSMRVMALIIVVLTGILMCVWGVVFYQESQKVDPDYGGLAVVLGAIFGVDVIITGLKAWQKHLER